MQKLKFLAPYNKFRKTTFPESIKKSGVYMIKENNKIVYIGCSRKNLYKTVYRHFENWNHPAQDVVTFNVNGKKKYTFRVIYCSVLQAQTLEKVLINKLKPRDNRHTHSDLVIDEYARKIYSLYTKTPVT